MLPPELFCGGSNDPYLAEVEGLIMGGSHTILRLLAQASQRVGLIEGAKQGIHFPLLIVGLLPLPYL